MASDAHVIGPLLILIGRILGLIASGLACVIWVLTAYGLVDLPPLGGPSLIVALLMLFLAIIAMTAAWHGHGMALMVLFFASFFPVGLYLLGTPGWFQMIGIANIGFLIAGFIIHQGRKRTPTETTG